MTKQNDKVKEFLLVGRYTTETNDEYAILDPLPDVGIKTILIYKSDYLKLQEELAEAKEILSSIAPSWLPEKIRHRRTEFLTKWSKDNTKKED